MRNRNTIYQIKPIYENDSGDDYTIMASNRLLKNWSVQDRLEPFYSTQEKARKTISEIHTILTNDMMSEIKNLKGIKRGSDAIRFKQIGEVLITKYFKIVEREVE